MMLKIKSFRWGRFALAAALTLIAVIAFGRAMAMDATSKTVPSASASTQTNAADPGVLPSNAKAATELYYKRADALRTDTELVDAEIANLKAHRDLDQARNGIFKSDAPTTAPTQTGMPFMQPPVAPPIDNAASSESRPPTVVQTAMVDGRWIASIRLGSGGLINTIHAGQDIRGVGRILSISLNDVTVSSGKKTYSLPFANDDSSIEPPRSSGMTVTQPMAMGTRY